MKATPTSESEKNPANTPTGEKVGYGHPPKHTQFRKGVSGNPSGRPTKPFMSFENLIYQQLQDTIIVNGKKKTLREALAMKVHSLALNGDYRSLKIISDIAKELDVKMATILGPENQAQRMQRMIAEYLGDLVHDHARAKKKDDKSD